MSLPNDLLSSDYMPPVSWQRTLNSVLKISGGLSTFGSLFIVTEILTDKKKWESPFRRLMLGMSAYDALGSSWLFICNWALPEGYWYGARGNYSTCQAQAFFIHLTLAVPVYNASLSLYYMLQIRYNWSDRRFARQVEPWVHGFALVNTLCYALLALFQNVYHPTGPLCLESYDPKECNVADPNLSDECIRVIGWANTFTAWWYSVVFVCMILASFFMYLVYCSVRAMEKKMVKWETQWRRTSTLPSEISATRVRRTWRSGASAQRIFQNWRKPKHTSSEGTRTTSVSQSQRDERREEQDNTSIPASETDEQLAEEEEEDTCVHGETSDPASDDDDDEDDEEHVVTFQQQQQQQPDISRRREQERQKRKLKLQRKQTRRSRRVARVGAYYLLVYLVSWLAVFICEVIIGRIMGTKSVSKEAWFVLFIFAFLLWPAQGFFNFLVYNRNRICRSRPGGLFSRSSATMSRFSSRDRPSSVPSSEFGSQSCPPSESEPI